MIAMLTPEGELPLLQLAISACTYIILNSCMYINTHTHTVVAGQVMAKKQLEILNWKKENLSWEDILSRLRPRTVPPGYTYHPWKQGMIHQSNSEIMWFGAVNTNHV